MLRLRGAERSRNMEPADRETRRFSDAGDPGTVIDLNPLSEEEKEELSMEMAKLEDEISTLRQVLVAKEKHLVDIKQKMGITPLNEFKHNLSKSWHDVQTSMTYKKTQETLTNAGQKATTALSNVSSAFSKKLGEMNLYYFNLLVPQRAQSIGNSPTFKSFEERVETTVTSLKSRVGVPVHSGGSFEDVLNSTANASLQQPAPGNRLNEESMNLK
ncbi:tumor protein D53 homolog isoform X2 [Callorhinchus milii]|uniref:Tumor protein D53-like protein n=2 Tax=Callorhinchus milii TaxID=7868 RepID=V9L911_CALMI|nr:tumor protein D53 homolog isoform X2 [Callorhinchus milii]|eukprot:gi/632962695/ref/XP_007897464.1/ PREDICTED: tumor protein D53 [Callorhinchus milii]